MVTRMAKPNSTLDKYFEDIRPIALISRDEEIELAKKVGEGDVLAADKLIQANLRFVIHIACKFVGRGLSLEDLIAEGNMGLIRAAKDYDISHGTKFISYAIWWIRLAMNNALNDVRMVRLPVSQIKTIIRLNKSENTLRQTLGRDPTFEEIADHAELVPAKAQRILGMSKRHLSLYSQMGENDGFYLIDTIFDEQEDTPEEAFLRSEDYLQIRQAVESLEERDAVVIRLYFGLDQNKALTLQGIGDVLGLSRERIRQIKGRGLEKLRRIMEKKDL